MAADTAEQQKQTLRRQKQNKFHISVYAMGKLLVGDMLRKRYNYRAAQETPQSKKPYIVLANHASPLDCFLLALSFPHMYFALTKKYEGNFGRWLIRRLFAPIVRTSSGERIVSAVARGYNVCFFPEGSEAPDGVTGEIPQAVAEIVKRSGASLITYRLEGAFFTKPVWAKHRRTGAVNGYIVHEYPAEELAHMKSRDLAELIRQDLWVDAFQVNEDCLQAYYAKDKAEGLENVLHRCPACGGVDTLCADGDHLRCGCGLDVVWNDFGLFESAGAAAPPFKNLRDWYRWQKEQDKQNK